MNDEKLEILEGLFSETDTLLVAIPIDELTNNSIKNDIIDNFTF